MSKCDSDENVDMDLVTVDSGRDSSSAVSLAPVSAAAAAAAAAAVAAAEAVVIEGRQIIDAALRSAASPCAENQNETDDDQSWTKFTNFQIL